MTFFFSFSPFYIREVLYSVINAWMEPLKYYSYELLQLLARFRLLLFYTKWTLPKNIVKENYLEINALSLLYLVVLCRWDRTYILFFVIENSETNFWKNWPRVERWGSRCRCQGLGLGRLSCILQNDFWLSKEQVILSFNTKLIMKRLSVI